MRQRAGRQGASRSAADYLSSERYLQALTGGEVGRAAVLYPNSYAVGMSSLATHTLWRLLAEAGWQTHRAFLDPEPGHSLETGWPLSSYHLLACTCSFELDYLHLAALLEAGGIPPLRRERSAEAPLLIAGGPGVTANPLPLAALFDLIFLGEVEEVWPRLAAALRQAPHARVAALEAAAEVPGILRPDQLPSAPLPRQRLREVDAYPTASVALTPKAQFSDMFLVEIGRGCPHTCRFCLAREIFSPFRPRSEPVLLRTIRPALEATRRVGLVGAALSDHPRLLELCETLVAEGAQLSTSSLRVDKLQPQLLELLASSGARSVTLAPEAGTEKLRASLGKRFTDEQVLAAAEAAQAVGLRGLKLYFMLGLPEETEADRAAIGQLMAEIHCRAPRLRLEAALSPLVPKPHTPWAEHQMAPVAKMRAWQSAVQRDLRRQGVRVTVGSARWALVQAAFSRGGEELGPVLVAAARRGGSLPAVRAALKEAGLRLEDYLAPPAEAPWKIVDLGA